MPSQTTSGDVPAALLRGLIEQYYPGIFSYINRLTGDRDLAEELAHRVFISPASDRRRLLRASDKRIWLYRRATALTCAAMPGCPGRFHWPWHRKWLTDEVAAADHIWGTPGVLDQALSALSLQERAALLLRSRLGFSLADTAAVLRQSRRDTRRILQGAWTATFGIYEEHERSTVESARSTGLGFTPDATEADQIPDRAIQVEPYRAESHRQLIAMLPLYADLEVEGRTVLDKHIARCQYCADRMEIYRRLDRDLQRMPDSWHSRRAQEHLYEAARRPAEDLPAREIPEHRLQPKMRFAFLCLVLALVVLIGAWIAGLSRAVLPAFAVTWSGLGVSATATPPQTESDAGQLTESPATDEARLATPLPAGPLPGGVTSSAVAWLLKNALPFDTSQLDGNPADLLPLKNIVGDARIVALSDSSFGTHELAVSKQRMMEYLVQQMGFNTLAIDSSWPQAELLNNYIQSGQGDPEELLLFITGGYRQTDDMLDTVQWLRAHNQDPLGIPRVSLRGIDILREYSHLPLDAVVAYLQRVDPAAVARTQGSNRDLLNYLVEHRSEYMGKSSWRDYYGALRNARTLLQYDSYALAGGATQRDFIRNQYLLENVMTLLRQAGPGGKIIIWGHNQDLGVNKDTRNLGALLRERFGSQYVSIALDFYQGAITANTTRRNAQSTLMAVHTVSSPPPGTYEDFLHYAGRTSFILDLRNARSDNDQETWLAGPHLMRSIAGTYNDCYPEGGFIEARLPAQFDALVYLQDVSPETMLFKLIGRADASCPRSPQNLDFASGVGAWQKSGTAARSYLIGISTDRSTPGHQIAYLRSNRPQPSGSGVLMQSFRADVYRGRRVRLAALLSASDTNGEGQLWLRIEGPGGESLASDSGPVKNGSDWQSQDIVLDVPADASRISIGISLDGQGELSVKDLQFEATTSNAPATQNPR